MCWPRRPCWPRRRRTCWCGWTARCRAAAPPRTSCWPSSASIGTAGGTGYTIEFGGRRSAPCRMEGRMTVCNMAIEAGARAGLVAVDEKTIEYVRGRPFAPSGVGIRHRGCATGARCTPTTVPLSTAVVEDRRVAARAAGHLGHVARDGAVGRGPRARPRQGEGPVKRGAIERALTYMGLEPNKPSRTSDIDKVFIGSCTNSRIEDLREAAAVVRRSGRRWRPTCAWRWWCQARAW
jgi:3-isopropylmalate/(R)-2-methylmalate dehydratase large subunit